MHIIVVEKYFDTLETLEKGLMNDSSPFSSPNNVALFVFPRPTKASIWMKNTRVPLDIIFITEDNVVAHIHTNAKPYDLTTIESAVDVKYVVEAIAGYVSNTKIMVGDKVAFSSSYMMKR